MRSDLDARLPAEGIVLSNRLSELERAADWLADHARISALPDDVAFAVRLCVEEALTNIVSYAFDEGEGEREIQLGFRMAQSEVVITLCDDGRPFDPLAAQPSPTTFGSPEEISIGGRGIILIKSFAGHLDYQRADGRNRLTLVFPFSDDKPTPSM